MTDTNATTLRNALARAIKNHVTTNGLKAKDAAQAAGVQYSRLSQILRGDVAKISSDALVNVLGGFGYRLTGITGSGNGTEIVLSLDKAEKVLPEIEKPVEIVAGSTVEDGEFVRASMILKDPSAIKMALSSPTIGYSGPGIDSDSTFDPDFDRVVSEDE